MLRYPAIECGGGEVIQVVVVVVLSTGCRMKVSAYYLYQGMVDLVIGVGITAGGNVH